MHIFCLKGAGVLSGGPIVARAEIIFTLANSQLAEIKMPICNDLLRFFMKR